MTKLLSLAVAVSLAAPVVAHGAELSRADKFLLTADDDTYVVVQSLQEYIPNICGLSRDEFALKTNTEVTVRSHTKSIKARKPDVIVSEAMTWRALYCGS